MKLSLPAMLVLFVLGAVAALVGDHGHVATGTTEYLTHSVPYIWSSPIWFPAMVGVATVSMAELRLHLPHPRTDRACGHRLPRPHPPFGAGAVIDAGTSRNPRGITAPTSPCTRGMTRLESPGFSRREDVNRATSCSVFGVGPWLVPLYFAFGVVAALLGELAGSARRGGA
jgi:hypothetical protein